MLPGGSCESLLYALSILDAKTSRGLLRRLNMAQVSLALGEKNEIKLG